MTLEEILVVERERCLESGRSGEGGGVREVADSDAGSNGPWYAGMDTCDTWMGK